LIDVPAAAYMDCADSARVDSDRKSLIPARSRGYATSSIFKYSSETIHGFETITGHKSAGCMRSDFFNMYVIRSQYHLLL
jgi:hypothetical protein